MTTAKTTPAPAEAADTPDAPKTEAPSKTAKQPKAASKSTASPIAGDKDAFNAAFGNFSDMFEQSRERFQSAMGDANLSADIWRDAAEDATNAVRVSSEVARESAKDIGEDVLGFVQTEIARFMEYTNDIMSAQTANDVMEINRDFVAHTVESRLEKARELNVKSVEAARRAVEPFNSTISAAVDRANELRDTQAQKI